MNSTRLSPAFFIRNALLIAFLILLVSFRYILSGDTFEWWQYLYFCAFTLGNFFIISVILFFVLGYPLARFGLRRTALAVCAATGTAVLIFIVADSFVYQQYRMHINLAMLEMTFLGGGQIVSFTPAMIGQIAFMCIAICAVACLSTWAAKKSCESAAVPAAKWFVTPILIGFLVTNIIYAYSFPVGKSEVTSINDKIPLNSPLRCSKFLLRIGVISQSDIDNLKRSSVAGGNRLMNYPLSELQCSPQKKMNVVFVLIDALRHDVLTPEIMPNVYKFAQTETIFSNHYAGGNATRHGVFSLFYGIPGTYWSQALNTQTPSALITALQKNDYSLGIFASAPLTRPEFHATVFSTVKNLRVKAPGESVLDRDRNSIDEFIAWEDKGRDKAKPFFSFMFVDNV